MLGEGSSGRNNRARLDVLIKNGWVITVDAQRRVITIAVAENPSAIITTAKEAITIRPIFADFLAATADGTV